MPSLPGGFGRFNPLPSTPGSDRRAPASSSTSGGTPPRQSATERAASIRSQRRAAAAAGDGPTTKADERRLKLARFRNPNQSVAKSAAHEGVVARPMDRQLSHSLETRRMEAKDRGTSVGRMKKRWQEEDEERERQRLEEEARLAEEALKEAEAPGTSASRLGNPMINELKLTRMPYEVLHPKQGKRKDDLPDMEI